MYDCNNIHSFFKTKRNLLFKILRLQSKNINSKNFKGGAISTLFGGAEIDLRNSELDEGGAVVDVSTIFGGTEIRIPESWPLDIRSTAIFGGVENKTSNEVKKKGKRLVIKSSTIFGGIEIKN